MNLYKRLALLLLCFYGLSGNAQEGDIDVVHYDFQISLSDRSDIINGKAAITISFGRESSQFRLHLASVQEDKGMQAFLVREQGDPAPLVFVHKDDRLLVQLRKPTAKGERRTFEIEYMGIPRDGLIISRNKYGDRTFFSDNWPDRARQWLPCNDVPSDKASVEFRIKAPAHYRVISNGDLVSETAMGEDKLTHWKETAPLPSKVMVIGVARFAVARVDSAFRWPVTAWVYPQDSAKGFYDYALADDILRFFEGYIGPYPYRKLANVQSKTIFGGMENANAIFYAEATVTGTRQSEALLAHEIAHQWFGNTATEESYAHLWLSEGFATYLTDVYIESKYGRDSFVNRLKEERAEVIAFSRQSKQPVVDSLSALMELLNPNSYQKGAWILHMLRGEVGDDAFKEIIRAYYARFKEGNANSRDFEAVAEKLAGRELGWFFKQWLHRPGVPMLQLATKMNGEALEIRIGQLTEPYRFDLEVQLTAADGTKHLERIAVTGKETVYRVKLKGPASVQFDPGTKLLFAEKR
ncbi:MAG TPA: M1 family metallopeptidase [Flavisolibacter sp.]|nr:M1 family metallopeptidase [Flavisolibacter sp.]